MNGDLIALLIVVVALAVLGFGCWCDMREKRRQRLIESLGVGGRGVRR